MGTEDEKSLESILRKLESQNWSTALGGVATAEQWCQGTIVGDPDLDVIVGRLVGLAGHVKWEVRRAIANVAAQVQHPAFEAALARLVTDDNSRVRQAAENAALRRRDSRHASTLGKQHVDRLNATLDDIEARFGARGRDAVRRAADQIANTFARELYHEVIRLVSPLAVSADRLREQLSAENVPLSGLREEAERLRRRVSHLRSVLDAMRAYTEQPVLTFLTEDLREVLEEAATLAKGKKRADEGPPLELSVPAGLFVEMSRSRLVQAFTNVLENAIESYDGLGRKAPVAVSAGLKDGLVTIVIQDSGCGMAAEVRKDATTLFATSKQNGTGFGLPLAVKIVEAEHGGRLDIESAPDEGTTVRITIRALH
jgi:nitrogen fixation/metabolism regulation signal transduction histidine kinase